MRKIYVSVVTFLKKVPWAWLVGLVVLAGLILGALKYRARAGSTVLFAVSPGDDATIIAQHYDLNTENLPAANTLASNDRGPLPIVDQSVVVETVEVEKVVEKTVEVERDLDGEGMGYRATEARMVVYTVDMAIIVHDTQVTLDQIERLAGDAGGYVVSINTTQYEEGLYGNAVIRVPAAELDTVVAQLEGLALEVQRKNKTGSDVTEEYVDLQSRVAVLEAAEQELLELYEVRQADGEVSDILEVYQELVNFRAEIETLTGRMQYLEESAAMARVSVGVTPDILAQPLEIERWRPEGTARDAFEVLVSSFQFLVDVLIWGAILVVPLALLVGLLFFGVGRLVRRRRKRAQLETPPDVPSEDGKP